jgi:predicted ArsR family transcriptional regulator
VDPTPDLDRRIAGIAALDQPLRRDLYRHLAVTHGWVTRDQAAAAIDVPRSVAAFHLDKLVDAGLLEARFERTSGRTGPGAGRPSKLYRRAPHTVALSLPERRYDLAGSLLAEAVAEAAIERCDIRDAVARCAQARGRDVGAHAHESARRRRSRNARRDAMVDVLEVQGYAPTMKGETIALRNCPFHTLAEEQRDLVCGMNREFLDGLIEGLGDDDAFDARLAPEAGYCCVRIEPR